MKHETLGGAYAKNPCAFCKLKQCSLTTKQIRAKQCLKKQCWHLVKYESHPWWTQREVIKQKKKEHKASATVLNYSM